MTARFSGLLTAFLVSTAFAAPAVMCGTDTARAGERVKSVVELFTSQGCSSCPPADALLEKFAKRADIIALTFNVDYWDYLGWKDTLASPANSARQRSYAHARGDGQVYTPQAVIDGIHHAVGSQKNQINDAIARARKALAGKRVPFEIGTDGDTLVIKVGVAPAGGSVKPATIWLALVKHHETVEVKRGENRGHKLTYYSVVRNFMPVGRWTGQEVTIKLPKQHFRNGKTDGCTALLQEDTAGPILAAAEIRDW